MIEYFEKFSFRIFLILLKLSDLELSSMISKLTLIDEFSFLSRLIDFANDNKHLNDNHQNNHVKETKKRVQS